MESVAFDISKREEQGRKTRENGDIPCIIYGGALENNIPAKLTRRTMEGILTCPKSSILSLNLDGNVETCVVKELQKNSFGKIIHIDFQYVNKNQIIKLKIPVNFIGQGLLESKRLLLETFMAEVELQGEADMLPEKIDLDVSNMEYGHTIMAKDLKLPEGIKITIDPEAVIATVAANEVDESEEESEDTTTAE